MNKKQSITDSEKDVEKIQQKIVIEEIQSIQEEIKNKNEESKREIKKICTQNQRNWSKERSMEEEDATEKRLQTVMDRNKLFLNERAHDTILGNQREWTKWFLLIVLKAYNMYL
jgi:hypothetical protein